MDSPLIGLWAFAVTSTVLASLASRAGPLGVHSANMNGVGVWYF